MIPFKEELIREIKRTIAKTHSKDQNSQNNHEFKPFCATWRAQGTTKETVWLLGRRVQTLDAVHAAAGRSSDKTHWLIDRSLWNQLNQPDDSNLFFNEILARWFTDMKSSRTCQCADRCENVSTNEGRNGIWTTNDVIDTKGMIMSQWHWYVHPKSDA